MKNINLIKALIATTVVIIFLLGCKKEDVPVVETNDVSSITDVSAICGGKISKEGSSTVLGRGVCWSLASTPTTTDSKTTDGAGVGSFTSKIDGLEGGTIYFIRAYASNSNGTGYGMAKSFKTTGQPKVYKAPDPITKPASNISSNSATLNATVNPNNLQTTVSFEYGTSVMLITN